MSLNGAGCLFLCTPCTVRRAESCTAASIQAHSRDIRKTVRAQLVNAAMGTFWGSAARRMQKEMQHSFDSVVPALASWAGPGNGLRMLYRLPEFDRLHVRSLMLEKGTPVSLSLPLLDCCVISAVPHAIEN